ncbi:unnamed protein product [Fusarium venenatum]|uniref:Uncharacterized protein n=1 Tax=Fusarium venenatum TaxID=56646 RepID=A0A2L2T5T5_9HYPO|nr:uncharacterized protein FVRRES_01511 [Fusarium venenatum]CEI64999.1 unnamed protein product [Fusarium venenatum]
MSNSRLQRPDMVRIRKLYPYARTDAIELPSFDHVSDRAKCRCKSLDIRCQSSVSKFTTSTKIFQPGSSPRIANPSLSSLHGVFTILFLHVSLPYLDLGSVMISNPFVNKIPWQATWALQCALDL